MSAKEQNTKAPGQSRLRRAVIIVLVLLVAAAIACALLHGRGDGWIYVQGALYTRSGENVAELPAGSVELGTLDNVMHRTKEPPTEELYAANIDGKYAGCPVYASGEDEDTILLYDFAGFYIPFVRETEPE